MSSGAAANFVTGAGVVFAACVAAGAVAAFTGSVAGLTAGAAAVAGAGAGDGEDCVSTVVAIVGVAAANGEGFVEAGEVATAGGATPGAEAFGSLTVAGAFGGAAHPEINNAKITAASRGANVHNIFASDIFSLPTINQRQAHIIDPATKLCHFFWLVVPAKQPCQEVDCIFHC